METLLQDIRFGLKLLRRDKAFSLTVLATLAVCVGANLAIFSVVQGVLLQPLPYADSHRLVTVFNSYPGAGVERASNGTVDFLNRRERVDAFQEVALYQGRGHTVGESGHTERVSSMRVTPSFFPLLEVEASLGRTFTEEEMEEGNHLKVVLTHGYWQEKFAGDAGVVGRELRIDGLPHTVVGVLPEDFRVVNREETRLFVPIALDEGDRSLEAWHNNNFQMMARLKPGVGVEQARAQNEALNQSLIDQWPAPNGRQLLEDAGFHTEVVNAQQDMVRGVRPALYLLWAGAGFVLLIGCVNITNLVLARTRNRVGELATRQALGARRLRLGRQILTEAVLLALLGGALGIGIGYLGLDLLATLGVERLPRGSEISVTGTGLLFGLALAGGAGVLFGALPVAHVMREDLQGVFRTETRTGTAGRKAVLLRGLLVTGQVALAFLLLSGAGLMLESFRAATDVDPGFEPEGLVTGFVSLPDARYPDPASRREFVDRLVAEVRALPGVRSAAVTTQLPFSGNNSASVILPEGHTLEPGESLLSPYQTWVAPGYFETMGIRLKEGRFFRPSAGDSEGNVIIIDEWLAARYWPGESPLGRRMVWGTVPEPGKEVDPGNLHTVVGVVETVTQNDLTASEHVGAYYFPYRQDIWNSFLTLVVRASGVPTSVTPSLRETVSGLDPEIPLFGVETMDSRISDSLAQRKTPMLLLVLFSGVALFLAVVGLYGVLAYAVAQRRTEIGIRMAMGSAPGDVFRLVVGQGLRITAVGLVLGGLAAVALARLIRSMLFAVEPTDPVVLGAVGLTLATVATLACVIPAFRATRVDPSSALSPR